MRNKNGEFVKNGMLERCQNLKRGSIAPSSEWDISRVLVSDKVGPIEWNEERRIVELGTLAHNCTAKAVQDLRNTASKHRSGLGSVLWIRCSCGNVNKIQTSKSHMGKKQPWSTPERLPRK